MYGVNSYYVCRRMPHDNMEIDITEFSNPSCRRKFNSMLVVLCSFIALHHPQNDKKVLRFLSLQSSRPAGNTDSPLLAQRRNVDSPLSVKESKTLLSMTPDVSHFLRTVCHTKLR